MIKNFIVKLLYLTPVGYVLSLFSLYSGQATPGVYVHLPRDAQMKVYIKRNPSQWDRLGWALTGLILISQSTIISIKQLGGDFGAVYSWIALLFGFVNFISALVPNLNWSKRLKILKVSFIEITVVVLLILITVLPSIIQWYFLEP
jgi:hypothetical protein